MSKSPDVERAVQRRRNSTSSATEASWDNQVLESSDSGVTLTNNLRSLQPHPDSGASQTLRRRVYIPDACYSQRLDSNTSRASTSSSANSILHPSRHGPFLTSVDACTNDHFQSGEGEDAAARRIPKKSASSPVLYALTPAPPSVVPVSPPHISSTYHPQTSPSSLTGSSPEPPPYTSLPPLMSIPPFSPSSGINGMSLAIPVPVPVSVPMHNENLGALAPGRKAHGIEMEDDGDAGTAGTAVIYSSWNDPRSVGPLVPISNGHVLETGLSRFENAPSHGPPTRSSSSSPRSNTSHHSPARSQYLPNQRVNKSKSSSSRSLRRRIFGVLSQKTRPEEVSGEGDTEGEWESEWESEGKAICTTPGMICAGETETETDEPSRHLPTARMLRTSSKLSSSFSPSNTNSLPALPWQWLLFEFSRLLAIVPASLGFTWCLLQMYMYVPDANRCSGAGRPRPDRIDYIVASLWALLTAHQCLSITTGLLTRWRHYYAPLSILVRLLALQGICWQATHLTINILEAAQRPVVVWAVIGTTTCTSRSIQIWVVSNLPTSSTSSLNGATDSREREKRRTMEAENGKSPHRGYGYVYWKKWNKWRRRRRWDWREVSFKCVLPAGVLYFFMAWSGELRREFGGC